ncbi:MAG TPA: DUF559 domain-containing protein [Propionibacteriaceae bacterium]|nr:DUF559 domain-containing protein [Propionibacteriaceae bacterium]
MHREWEPELLLDHIQRRRSVLAPGGVFKAAVVRRRGDPRQALEALTRNGRLVRVRRGWYRLADADPTVVRAVEAGGVLTCVSALAFAGIWVPETAEIHARPARSDMTLATDVHQCGISRRLPAPRSAVDPVGVALRAAAGCLSAEPLVAAMDSAIDGGFVRRADLPALLANTSGRASRLAGQARWAQSGTETLIRVRLARRHLRVTTQVVIPGVGRVDILVGDRLVLEADSRAHHADEDSYRRDRARDLSLARLGFRVLRLTWEQVMFEWDLVEETILSLVAEGEHRWTRDTPNPANRA